MTFAFGNHPVPFYILKINAVSDIEIQRSHPCEASTTSPIVNLNLGQTSQVDKEGNVATLFPRLAEMYAREQALALAKQRGLPISEAIELEKDAVEKTKMQESCIIKWDEFNRRYSLHHQALAGRKYYRHSREGSRSGASGGPSDVFHLTITSSTSTSRALQQAPTIMVTAPSSASDGLRNQRFSLTTVLVALDLESRTLSVSPGLITSMVPSLYAVDTLIAAVLTIAAFDKSTKPILANMVIGTSKLDDFPDSVRVNSPKPPAPAPAPSVSSASKQFSHKLFATQAEREDAQKKETAQEASLMQQIKSKKPKSKRSSWWRRSIKRSSLSSSSAPPLSSSSSSSSGPQKADKKKNSARTTNDPVTAVQEEVDVEKYGRFGSESTSQEKREELPRVTRAALRAIFWAYEMIVKGLDLFVKSIAWLLVKLTRCVTCGR